MLGRVDGLRTIGNKCGIRVENDLSVNLLKPQSPMHTVSDFSAQFFPGVHSPDSSKGNALTPKAATDKIVASLAKYPSYNILKKRFDILKRNLILFLRSANPNETDRLRTAIKTIILKIASILKNTIQKEIPTHMEVDHRNHRLMKKMLQEFEKNVDEILRSESRIEQSLTSLKERLNKAQNSPTSLPKLGTPQNKMQDLPKKSVHKTDRCFRNLIRVSCYFTILFIIGSVAVESIRKEPGITATARDLLKKTVTQAPEIVSDVLTAFTNRTKCLVNYFPDKVVPSIFLTSHVVSAEVQRLMNSLFGERSRPNSETSPTAPFRLEGVLKNQANPTKTPSRLPTRKNSPSTLLKPSEKEEENRLLNYSLCKLVEGLSEGPLTPQTNQKQKALVPSSYYKFPYMGLDSFGNMLTYRTNTTRQEFFPNLEENIRIFF